MIPNSSKSMRRESSRPQSGPQSGPPSRWARRSLSLASLLAGLLSSHLGMAATIAGTGVLLATAPSARAEGEAAPEKGREVQKKMDELIKSTQDGGGVIPQELEALIKLIPIGGGQSQSQGGEDPKNKSRNRDLPNPDDPMGKKDEPKDPRK